MLLPDDSNWAVPFKETVEKARFFLKEQIHPVFFKYKSEPLSTINIIHDDGTLLHLTNCRVFESKLLLIVATEHNGDFIFSRDEVTYPGSGEWYEKLDF